MTTRSAASRWVVAGVEVDSTGVNVPDAPVLPQPATIAINVASTFRTSDSEHEQQFLLIDPPLAARTGDALRSVRLCRSRPAGTWLK